LSTSRKFIQDIHDAFSRAGNGDGIKGLRRAAMGLSQDKST